MKSLSIDLSLTFLSGCLYALAYPTAMGEGWFPLLFVSLPLFLWKLENAPLKRALGLIVLFNLGLDVVGYYWIPHTLREFGHLPYLISILLGTLSTLILQPHWWIYAFWKKYRPAWDWSSEEGVLITALILTLLERYVPQQFPSYVGSPWLHLKPYLGLTPYLGVPVFSFMTYWVALETVTQLSLKKLRPQVWIAFVVFIVANALLPLKSHTTDHKLQVRIVQANVGNFLKVTSERGDVNSVRSILRDYEDLSTFENGVKPDLIVWPETAYPNTFYGQESILHPLFIRIMEMTGAEMLIGGYDQDTTKSSFDLIESVYNSSLLLNGTRVKTIYHKNILIPFGETLPFGPLNKKIVTIVPEVSLFARGEGTPLLETRTGHRFVTPICYEILDSNYMRALLNQWMGNHFIVNHTNDSWYGDTAEPRQHLFLSKWRALEFQLPIVRSTNTGISSVIFTDGTESKRLGIGEKDILDVAVPLGKGESTLYQVYGIFPGLVIILLILAVTWWREKNGNRP